MISLENARPTANILLSHIESFEEFCMGNRQYPAEKFREINRELSIGAVLMLGKCRYVNEQEGKRLIWRGLDNREHDLGFTHDANIMRDYPGFHANRSLSLGKHLVKESKIIPTPNGKGHMSLVILEDGSTGIGPNYRMALRNAALKMHLTNKFNFLAMADNIWKKVWGHA